MKRLLRLIGKKVPFFRVVDFRVLSKSSALCRIRENASETEISEHQASIVPEPHEGFFKLIFGWSNARISSSFL